jgi:hypothetical protein
MPGTSHRGYLSSTLSCCCPRCREGKLFKYPVSVNVKRNMDMNKDCPVCGQPTEIEVGFYYGTAYVSYLLAIFVSALSFVLWYFTIGMSVQDNRFFYWLGANGVLLIVMQPILMRLSRSIWISWFVRYDPEWQKHNLEKYERVVPDQMNNW